MSHVDEGALHAYLDGALDAFGSSEAERIRTHLTECAECRTRLEEERGVRAEASSILAMAAPEVELPSIEDLRAYVEATRPPVRRSAGRLQQMGWAASVVLALGIGWTVRGGQLDADARSVTPPNLEALREGPAEMAASEGPTAAASVDAPVDVRPDRSAPIEQLADVGSSAGAAAEKATLPEPAEGAAVMTASAEALDDAPDAAMIPELASAAPSAVASLDSPLDTEVDVRRLGAGDVALMAEAVSDTSSVGGGGVAEQGAGAASEESGRSVRSEAPVVVTSAFESRGAASGSAASDEDEAFDEEPSLVVPGYEVLSVTNLGDRAQPLGVHVVQSLGGDRVFEIFHLQPGLDVGSVVFPETDVNEARREIAGRWVVIRGPLAVEDLDEMLDRLWPSEGH